MSAPVKPRASSFDKKGKNFYFLKKNTSNTSLDGQDGKNSPLPSAMNQPQNGSWFNPLSWGNEGGSKAGYMPINNSPSVNAERLQKLRKVPIKIEPKVFFANERTFLAWLHMSVTLASISMAIVALADANEWSQLYGLLLMPVSIAFCVYSLWLYVKRASMLRRKDPGPYENQTGPIVLATLLSVSIVINFCVKLYDLA
mmetsp:Transcript_24609/g.45857  ORF Transcript_24609/g.45857 Transcript_24609/m.45857 type:complete len:199 (-) Transcript_24609:248-844(-)